ncbi:HPr family phosphocarrier protein [Alkalicoccobacillus murimartini]|uniref:Catabolite repression HPr-like protein n=1 Tax=Alkalicoccobacillus murimartini TaxID=171685 RepID=A0ABT9YG79_9BACI|nr:HPr family phosphocarrier protein [Alkalicoccobacillus murimartini]MDQ0206696.1 catabolite repression HPr-like protein [Alkalicoccobacillus murimartini]
MLKSEVKVAIKGGLQARPAALFVQEANRFSSIVNIEKDGKVANAKSIMGIMSLAIRHDASIVISTDGHDEKEALDTLVDYIQNPS